MNAHSSSILVSSASSSSASQQQQQQQQQPSQQQIQQQIQPESQASQPPQLNQVKTQNTTQSQVIGNQNIMYSPTAHSTPIAHMMQPSMATLPMMAPSMQTPSAAQMYQQGLVDLSTLQPQYNNLMMSSYGIPTTFPQMGKQQPQLWRIPQQQQQQHPGVPMFSGEQVIVPGYSLLNSAGVIQDTTKCLLPGKALVHPGVEKSAAAAAAAAAAVTASRQQQSSPNASANKPVKRKRSQTGRRRRSNEWKKEEVILLLQCTKLLINCELKTISQALFSCIKRSPGKCWGRAAEKKLKRMKIFVNWKTCSKIDVVESIDEHLRKLGALHLPIPPHVEKVAKRLEAVEKAESQTHKKIL